MKLNLPFIKHCLQQFLLILFCSFSLAAHAQENTKSKAPNLIIITTDGFRWQEVFNGMDFSIANKSKFNHGDSAYLYKKYGASIVSERQKLLII